MICLATEWVEDWEGHLSNVLSDRNADKRKSMDFGGTILENLDKHRMFTFLLYYKSKSIWNNHQEVSSIIL